MFRLIGWLMWLLRREHHEIGRKGLDRYLTRWTLWGKRFADKPRHNLFLHCFHRGDPEPYSHCHPWAFWSLILWGGYWEITPCETEADIADAVRRGELVRDDQEHVGEASVILRPPVYRRRWYGPLSLLRRPADWKHRVELPPGRRTWTLVWCGPRTRSWGFWCPQTGFLHWRQHQANQDAGKPGCG